MGEKKAEPRLRGECSAARSSEKSSCERGYDIYEDGSCICIVYVLYRYEYWRTPRLFADKFTVLSRSAR